MIELARLYQEVAELVQQQEPAVEQINQGAQDVVENVDNANKQISSAIVSARKARRWKWYILLVVSTFFFFSPLYEVKLTDVVVIIAIIIGVVVGVTKN
jgi:syntaxin 1B/2/3